MNKIATMLILLIPFISPAQFVPTEYNIEADLEDLQIYLHSQAGLSGRPGLELKGTPFLFDDFRPADLYFSNRSRALGMSVKLNCYTDEVYYLDKGTLYVFQQGVIDMFTFRAAGDTSAITIRNVIYDKGKKHTFLQVLYEGKIILYKKHYKEYIEADYTGPYNANRRYNQYLDKPRYFIQMTDGSLKKLNLIKKQIVNLFSDRAEEINEFIDSHTIKLSEEHELVKVVAYYDQLIQ